MIAPIEPARGRAVPGLHEPAQGMCPMIPDDLRPLAGLIDTTTDEAVGVCRRPRPHATRSACPGRNEP
jgi:hypothetical protein